MKRFLLVTLAAVLLGPALLHAAKPRPPLQVSITAIQTGLTPADIKPGDAVELKISAQTLIDTAELKIDVELHGGAELLSGAMSWSGPAKKGEVKSLLITVRAPMHGNGRVRARISTPPSSGTSFAGVAEYHLGRKAGKKPAPAVEKKKDGKGREIMEHRVN